MPAWKKVIVSGSDAILNSLIVTNGVTITGSLSTTGSNTLIGSTTLTGSLNISGSTTQIGNNTLLGNTTLSGSIIISGSTGDSSVQVYGNMTHDGYVRFNPVSTNIDTSISASYIYVSGSTNDLYFSQNGSGYNNVTRLRWLEGNLYTGLLHGGLITTASSTVYRISSGSGIIVNLNASLADDPYPIVQFLQWGNLSASISAFTSSYQQVFVGIDATNNIFAQGTPFSNGQFDSIINIGGVFFQNQSTINGFKTQPSVAYGFEQQQNTFNRAFGPLKLSGYTLAPSGSSTGSLIVASGTAYAPGSNYTVDPNESYYAVDNGTNVSKIFRYRQSGSTWVYDTNAGAGYATIDPTQYSNNGVLTAVPGGGSNREWSIQRVFWFPNSVIKAIVVYYGNATYATELDAIANISFETFVEAPNTSANAIYLGAIVVRNNADFTDSDSYKIQPSGLFRQVGGSGGGGSIITQTLSGLSDVLISGPTDGQALVYDNTAAKWKNSSTLTANLTGNASTATSASYASTASYVVTAQTASYVLNAESASFAATASYALNTVSASYSQTASYVNPLNQTVEITGSLLVQNSIDSSLRFLFDSLGTSSLDWEDGYLYNGSGSISVDWRDKKLYDSNVDNSVNWDSRQLIKSDGTTVTLNWETGAFTGSMLGTASFATQALSSSFATTASYILNGVGSTFPFTGSALITGSLGIIGSLTVSGSIYGIKSSTGELLTNNTPTVEWGNLILSDTTGQQSVKWGDRTLRDQASALKLDWENGITYDSIGKDSVNWQARQLINTGLISTIDWENTQLFDGSTIESVNWSQRKLYDSGNTLVLDWEANTFTGNSNTANYATSASFASTASFVNTLNQNLTVNGTLNVTNLNALTSSIQYITSSQLDISTNIIKLNTTAPLRYGGIAVVDSGSSPQTSGSLLFDSQNNQWIYVHQSTAGSPTTSSILIMGPQTFNNIGNEITIGTNRLTKGSAGDLGEHITSSNITDTGTVVSINSNTEVTGSLTVNGSFIATGSNGTINTDTSNLLSSDRLSVDWGNRLLYDPTGLQTSLNWRIRNLFDTNESSSLDWNTRQLNNAASTPTVDWNNNILYDSNAVDSVDWDNRNLFDSNFKKSTDWRIRNLFDSNESSSLAWQARQLNNDSGNTVLTWSNGIEITGSTVITGSLRGNVSALSIASNTASLDMSTNNFFTLNLVNGANTHINPTNINPGQTVNIRVNQGSAGTGTVSFPSFVDQPSGSAYTGSQVANAIDIVTMITFDSSLVFVSSIRNMI